jgi:hypothetical protein
MSEYTELQEKLDLIEELQVRLENRQQGFGQFSHEKKPREEQETPPGEFEAEEFVSLERLTDFFGNITADEVNTFGETLRMQFTELLSRAVRLLDDARHFDPVKDLAKDHFTDKANFIQAADEIFEEISEELHELKQRAVERRIEPV